MRPAPALTMAVCLLAGGCSDAPPPAGEEPPAQPALSAQEMRGLLEQRQACALASFGRQGHGGKDYPRVLLGKVSADLVQADAKAYAAESLALFEQINPPSTEYARLENAIHAIGEAASREAGGHAQLQAMALHAYYESLVTGQDCPVDPRILRLVNK